MTDWRLRAAIAALALAGAAVASYLIYARYTGTRLVCTTGGCDPIVTEESSVSARCTSIHASDGSSERTITHSTTAKNNAENFTGRFSVTSDVS